MKIVHICASAMTFRFFLREHLKNLTNKGHCVIAVCGEDDSDEAEFCEKNNIQFVHIPLARNISLASDIKSLFYLTRFFLKERPDIVHTHTPKASLLGTFSARVANIKNVVFHCHGLAFIRFNKVTSKVGFFIERLPILFAHKTLAVSPSLARFLQNNKFSFGKNIGVLGAGSICGVDTHLFSLPNNHKNDNKALNKHIVIGYLGRINEDKGIRVFIDIISKLRSQGFNVTGNVAGMLDNDINIVFPDYINYTGSIEREQAPHLLSSCDIFLFPSCREGFGLAAAEASSMELPVLAFDIVGIQDVVINGKTGFLAPPNDADTLIEKCVLLLSSADLRLKLGKQGRTYISENFSQDVLIEEFSNFYSTLL